MNRTRSSRAARAAYNRSGLALYGSWLRPCYTAVEARCSPDPTTMALFITILSVAYCYLSPGDLVPALAPYHLQQFLLGSAAAVSVFVVGRNNGGLTTVLTALVLCFWFALGCSLLVRGEFRASLEAMQGFMPTVLVYGLLALNAYSVPRIKTVGTILAFCGVAMALHGIVVTSFDPVTGEDLLTGGRLRAYGILHDPNDFAQFLLISIAFLGFSWRKYNPFANLILVVIPGFILLYAVYLTGSRGAVFGLVAMIFVTTSRRMGWGKALVLGVVIFGLLLTMKFGGGRNISLHEGSASGRITAWGAGISQLRSNPIFGVGFGQFTEYNDLTAHNSFVLCFSELGFVGYFFWLASLVACVVGLESLAKAASQKTEDAEFARCVTVVRAAFYAQIATSWFLSRTYAMTLFTLLAMASVLISMRRDREPSPVMPIRSLIPVTLVLAAFSIILIYATIRARAF